MSATVDRGEAEAALTSGDPHARLQAARFFQLAANEGDVDRLRAALKDEEVSWIRLALDDALRLASGEAESDPVSLEDETNVPDEVYRKALGEATRSLVHEIRPLLGRIRLVAAREVTAYEDSDLKRTVDRLSDLVDAMNHLREATAAPRMEEFDLAEWIKDVVEEELKDAPIEAEFVGAQHLVVLGDARLLAFVLCNSVRNAAEATLEIHDPLDVPSILVSWGDTDRDYWIAVSDRGPGPPRGAHHAFRQGRTTKEGHLGMGLAVAYGAITSLSGEITLRARTHAEGTTLEARWPKPHAVS